MKPYDAKQKLTELIKEIQSEGVQVTTNLGRIYLKNETENEYIALEKIPFVCSLMTEFQPGETLYWAMSDGTVDECVVERVFHDPIEGGDQYPVHFKFTDGKKGLAEIDALGKYIFREYEPAAEAAVKFKEEFDKEWADDE